MKRLVRFLLVFPLVAGVACSSDGGPDYASEIDESNMEGAAETGYEFVSDVVYGMMQGEPTADIPFAPAFAGGSFGDRLLADIRSRADRRSGRPGALSVAPLQPVLSVCEPTETGVDIEGYPIDSDGDGIPDDYKLSFPANCTETEGDWVYVYSGSVRIRDVAGLYGYRLDIANLKLHEENTATEDEFTFAANGSENALYDTDEVTHATNLSYSTIYSVSGEATAPGMMSSAAETYSYKFTWVESTSFDPAGVISLDAPIPSGEFDIDLDFRAFLAGGGENFAFRFHLTTPVDLGYDTGCNGIEDGQLKGALNDSEDIWFLITWTGCNTTTYETHGTTDGGTPAVRKFAAR